MQETAEPTVADDLPEEMPCEEEPIQGDGYDGYYDDVLPDDHGHLRSNADREKYTLTVGEASSYFHIGEKKLREIIEENPTADFILMSGKRIMIKRTSFEQFLDRKNWI